MAQFVTHIQPTLVESSHHHIPGFYTHGRHPKEGGHQKESHEKDHEKSHGEKAHYKDSHHRDCHQKDCHQKDCHIRNEKEKRSGGGKDSHQEKEQPKLPKESPPRLSKESLKESEHYYKDSHGQKHLYDIHFVDSQGICRESEVRRHGETDVNGKSVHSKSEYEISKPVPPQFIDIHPVHSENKTVSTFLFTLSRAISHFLHLFDKIYSTTCEKIYCKPFMYTQYAWYSYKSLYIYSADILLKYNCNYVKYKKYD